MLVLVVRYCYHYLSISSGTYTVDWWTEVYTNLAYTICHSRSLSDFILLIQFQREELIKNVKNKEKSRMYRQTHVKIFKTVLCKINEHNIDDPVPVSDLALVILYSVNIIYIISPSAVLAWPPGDLI